MSLKVTLCCLSNPLAPPLIPELLFEKACSKGRRYNWPGLLPHHYFIFQPYLVNQIFLSFELKHKK